MNQTQKDLNIEKYLGKWYEIAKFPFKYETNCYFSQATYTFKSNILNIQNDCLDKDRNVLYSRNGEGTIPNLKDKSKIRVVFNDGLPADPEGDYWIFWTDYDRYSIVGNRTRTLLWILSRREKISVKDVPMLISKVKSFGFDDSKLISNNSLIYK